LIFPATEIVDRLGEDLFPRARFTRDQDRGIGVGDLPCLDQGLLNRFASGDLLAV